MVSRIGAYPLLCRTPLVVKAHYRPALGFQVGHDKSHSGEQLPKVELLTAKIATATVAWRAKTIQREGVEIKLGTRSLAKC